MKKSIFFLFIASSLSMYGMEMGISVDKDGDPMVEDADYNRESSSWIIENKRGKSVLVYLGRKNGTKIVPSNKQLDMEGYFCLENKEKVIIELDQIGTEKFNFYVYDKGAFVKCIKRLFDINELRNNIEVYPKYIIESDYTMLTSLEDTFKLNLENDHTEVKNTRKRK